MRNLPYWRLSSFYFFYFSFVGAFALYWPLYPESLDFNPFKSRADDRIGPAIVFSAASLVAALGLLVVWRRINPSGSTPPNLPRFAKS